MILYREYSMAISQVFINDPGLLGLPEVLTATRATMMTLVHIAHRIPSFVNRFVLFVHKAKMFLLGCSGDIV